MRVVGAMDVTVDITDEIPARAQSWIMVGRGGGVDESLPNTLVVSGIAIAVGQIAEVVFELLEKIPGIRHNPLHPCSLSTITPIVWSSPLAYLKNTAFLVPRNSGVSST